MFQQYKKLWWVLLAFIILSPLGLLATGTAFGEWGVDQLQGEAGFIPQGLAKLADFWQHAPMPDYSIPGFSDTFVHSAIGYICSAVVGSLLILVIIGIFSKIVKE